MKEYNISYLYRIHLNSNIPFTYLYDLFIIWSKFLRELKFLIATDTVWKVFVFGVFLVLILQHLDWIRRDTPYSVRITRQTPNIDTFHAVRGCRSKGPLPKKWSLQLWISLFSVSKSLQATFWELCQILRTTAETKLVKSSPFPKTR